MTDNEANKLFGEEVLNSVPVLETMYADIFVEGWLGGYSFLAIVDDSPSCYGINGGRVRMLKVWRDFSDPNRNITLYDKRWKQEPSAGFHSKIVDKIVKKLNSLPPLSNLSDDDYAKLF